ERASNLFSLETYFVVVYEGFSQVRGQMAGLPEFLARPLTVLRNLLSSRRQIGFLETALDRGREILDHKVMSFVAQLQDVIPIEVLDKQRAFTFLRQLVNYEPYKIDGVRLKYDHGVDFQLGDSALECYRDHLLLDDYYVRVLSLKEPPGQTFAHML